MKKYLAVIALIALFTLSACARPDDKIKPTEKPVINKEEQIVPQETIPAKDTPSKPVTTQQPPTPITTTATTPTPEPTPPVDTTPALTMDVVAQHNTASDCYTVVSGTVYDLTSYIKKHPGGSSSLIAMCGINATAAYNAAHAGQSSPLSALSSLAIGPLES